MDKIPFYFDMPSSHTVSREGLHEIQRELRSIILTCTAAGLCYHLWSYLNAREQWRTSKGVIVAVKKAWKDSALTKLWVQKILSSYTKNKHVLLVWDTFTTLEKECYCCRWSESKIQPLDVSLLSVTVVLNSLYAASSNSTTAWWSHQDSFEVTNNWLGCSLQPNPQFEFCDG